MSIYFVRLNFKFENFKILLINMYFICLLREDFVQNVNKWSIVIL